MKEESFITLDYVRTQIHKRIQDAHKGNFGRVLVVAGSKGMAGAAVLCTRGVLRAGAGVVSVGISEELFPIIQIGVPEATCIRKKDILGRLLQFSAIVAGPGVGINQENKELIQDILSSTEKTVILDADGLTLFQDELSILKHATAELVITPHPGEAARLLNSSAAEINKNRVDSAQELAKLTGAVTILKGAATVVASPNGSVAINTTGNPGMATGGSGDVLAGVIGALAGQGLSAEVAGKVGVFIHGLAGDLAAIKIGEYGLIASDISAMVAGAIKSVLDIQSKMEE